MLCDFANAVIRRWQPRLPENWQTIAYTASILLSAFPVLSTTAEYTRIFVKPDTRATATRYLQQKAKSNDRFLIEPETVTLDNRLFSASIVISDSDYDGQHFHSTIPVNTQMEVINPETNNPRYILMDFIEMESRKDAHDNTYYELPPIPGYSRNLRHHYRFKAPYTIFIPEAVMAKELTANGFESLYARIQKSKTTLQSPGPLFLLLEQRSTTNGKKVP